MEDNVQTLSADHRQVGFGEAIKLFFSQYFNFAGRSSRGAFWWWMLASIIISIALTLVDVALGMAEISPFSSLFALLTLIPGIALTVRRLHDTGKSGFWMLIAFTIIGLIFLLIWYVRPGDRETNKYGPDVEAGRA